MSDLIRISEIFGPTIQGEGALIGQPTVFVRTGGCDYRCTWCDTLHAVDSQYRHEWKPMSAEDIFAEIEKLSGGKPLMISLSGGNPAIQPLGPLIALGKSKGYKFALETQGSIAQDWFADLDVLTLSPKPPSSGMTTDWDKFDECVKSASPSPLIPLPSGRGTGGRSPTGRGVSIALKIVIFNDADYAYARDASARYPHLPLYLQPGNETEKTSTDILMARMRWLTEKITTDQWYNATILPQLHVLMWGNMRGV